jgi:hypothetical protein
LARRASFIRFTFVEVPVTKLVNGAYSNRVMGRFLSRRAFVFFRTDRLYEFFSGHYETKTGRRS